MALRERNVLQQVGVCVWIKIARVCVNASNKHRWPVSCLQIVNLIEETGHFNVTNTTFDFDLFSLDESTVRKLQSYLEATATWQEVQSRLGGGRLPFFTSFVLREGSETVKVCSQEMKRVGKQIMKRSESYSILRRKCSYVASRLQINTTTLLLSSSISCWTGRSLPKGARTAGTS